MENALKSVLKDFWVVHIKQGANFLQSQLNFIRNYNIKYGYYIEVPNKVISQTVWNFISHFSKILIWTLMHSFHLHSCPFKQPQWIRQYLLKLLQKILQAEVQTNHHVFSLYLLHSPIQNAKDGDQVENRSVSHHYRLYAGTSVDEHTWQWFSVCVHSWMYGSMLHAPVFNSSGWRFKPVFRPHFWEGVG